MKLKSALAVCILFASSVCSGGEQTGRIYYVTVRAGDGLVYFMLQGAAKTNSPSCASIGYWMIRDENSNAGKQQYALLLSAQATGKTVSVSGLNTCNRWSDGEDVNSILVVSD